MNTLLKDGRVIGYIDLGQCSMQQRAELNALGYRFGQSKLLPIKELGRLIKDSMPKVQVG
jgi:hypothetical protein